MCVCVWQPGADTRAMSATVVESRHHDNSDVTSNIKWEDSGIVVGTVHRFSVAPVLFICYVWSIWTLRVACIQLSLGPYLFLGWVQRRPTRNWLPKMPNRKMPKFFQKLLSIWTVSHLYVWLLSGAISIVFVTARLSVCPSWGILPFKF